VASLRWMAIRCVSRIAGSDQRSSLPAFRGFTTFTCSYVHTRGGGGYVEALDACMFSEMNQMMGYSPKWVGFRTDNWMKEYWHANRANFSDKAEPSLVVGYKPEIFPRK
jgi:hypothetical protein